MPKSRHHYSKNLASRRHFRPEWQRQSVKDSSSNDVMRSLIRRSATNNNPDKDPAKALNGPPEIVYPSVEDLIELNKRVLLKIRMKKADSHKVLSHARISHIMDSVKATHGDIYDKAVVLISELVYAHAFDSGNRRTAYAATRAFIQVNGERFRAKPDPRVMQGIRERFYSFDEIKVWLKDGQIKEFSRFPERKEQKR